MVGWENLISSDDFHFFDLFTFFGNCCDRNGNFRLILAELICHHRSLAESVVILPVPTFTSKACLYTKYPVNGPNLLQWKRGHWDVAKTRATFGAEISQA